MNLQLKKAQICFLLLNNMDKFFFGTIVHILEGSGCFREVYEDKKKRNGAPDIVFGVLFYWYCNCDGFGKRKSAGKYADESGTGGRIPGRRLE